MRFVHNVFVLWFLVFVMVSSVLLYSRTSSEPSELQKLGFGMCSDQPCFMGIVPGVTTWKDAIATLKNYDLKEEDSEHFSVATAKVGFFYFYISGVKEGTVTSVELSPRNSINIGIPLSAIIQWVGKPCAVGFLDGDLEFPHPRLFYPSVWVDVVLYTDRVTQDAFADSIIIQPKDEALRCTSTSDFPMAKWKGFASWSRYINP